MLKLIKNLLQDNILYISFAITILIAYLSFTEIPKTQVKISHLDKIGHLTAYFTLAICWLSTFIKYRNKKYYILFSCIIYGIIIEVFQPILTNYRTASYLDVLANSLGVILGLLVFNHFFKKKKVK